MTTSVLALSDILFHITACLDNDTLLRLYLVGLASIISEFARSQLWWYHRTQWLVCREVDWIDGETDVRVRTSGSALVGQGACWKRGYIALQNQGPEFTTTADYNSVVLVHTLLAIGANPSLALKAIIRGGNPEVIRLVFRSKKLRLELVHCYELEKLVLVEDVELVREFVRMLSEIDDSDSVRSFIDETLPVSLCEAVDIGDLEIVRYLATLNPVLPRADKQELIKSCVQRDWSDMLSLVLSMPSRAAVTFDRDRILCMAVELDRLQALRLLIPEFSAERSITEWQNAMVFACKFRSVEMVRLLLSITGTDPTFDGNCCLRLARKYKREDVIELLVEDERVRLYKC